MNQASAGIFFEPGSSITMKLYCVAHFYVLRNMEQCEKGKGL